MNEMGIKKDAAGTANASDMIGKNTTKDIIAHALNKGKTAVYLKRDGWYMSPQRPGATGDYLVMYRDDNKKVNLYAARVFSLGQGKFFYAPVWEKAIAWQRIDVPAWAPEVAAEE